MLPITRYLLEPIMDPLVSAKAEVLPITRYLLEPNGFERLIFERNGKKVHKTITNLANPRAITFWAKKLVVATYAGKRFKTVQFIKTKNSYLRRIVFEKTKKNIYDSNIQPHFSKNWSTEGSKDRGVK